MTLSRRKFVHLLSIATTACTALITPAISWAAWVNDAFNANETEEAYKKLFGSTSLKKTKKVKLKVPKVPDNNNAVPISVKTDIQNVDSISLFVENNPQPLVAIFEIPDGTLPEISTRIRIYQTTTVTAVVKTGEQLFSKSQRVTITDGQCGG